MIIVKVQVVDYQAQDAAQKFCQSLHQTGFAVLINHPIKQDLVESIYKNWLQFFNSKDKHDYDFKPDTQDGLFSSTVSETAKGYDKKDLKEFYHVYPWGQIPSHLNDEILSYYKLASELAAELLAWIEEFSPAEVKNKYSEALPQMIADTPNTLLRVLHYPPFTGEEEEGAVRAAAHEDINLLTILPAANEPGLQVKGLDQQWQDVPNDFGSLVINIGDMLQEASQAYYPSTTHQVINPSGASKLKPRIALPLFLHPRSEVVLSERYTAGTYLDERLKELGLK